MKAELVKKEGNKVTLKITVDNNKFEEAVNKAYNKTKGKYNIPGFRKGKAPMSIVEKYYGKEIFVRGLIEFTNYCKNDCYYCGIRCSNKKANRYRLSEEDILACC